MLEFCKENIHAIEYNMMKMLSDQGMKNKLFLVTGARANCSEKNLSPEGNSFNNLVSFHRTYLDYYYYSNFEGELSNLQMPEYQLSYPSYFAGSTTRPEGVDGVFVVTFADPDTQQVSLLHDACKRCNETEADVLLIELANTLQGSVTVCTGDSDIVAVMTACGREDITLRMDNKTYHKDREMQTTPFGKLLFAPPGNPTKLSAIDLSLSENRFRALCDITADQDHLLSLTRDQHTAFENILDSRSKDNLKEDVAEYLYKAGIRGSLYRVFLSRFFQSKHQDLIVNSLGLSVNSAGKKTVFYIFETLCPLTPIGSYLESDPSISKKRKLSCSEGNVPELDLDNDVGEEGDMSQTRECV